MGDVAEAVGEACEPTNDPVASDVVLGAPEEGEEEGLVVDPEADVVEGDVD